jgi:hypothetical protein
VGFLTSVLFAEQQLNSVQSPSGFIYWRGGRIIRQVCSRDEDPERIGERGADPDAEVARGSHIAGRNIRR